MRKAIFKSVFAMTIAVFISSCAAIHHGYMTNSAALSSANFKYVKKNIKGEATATYVLGIGGHGKETLVDSAKQQMLASSPLKSNQTLTNLTVNFKSSYYLGIVVTVKCTVTADVVEFISSNKAEVVELESVEDELKPEETENIKAQPSPVKDELKDNQDKNKTDASLKVGDKVMYTHFFDNEFEATVSKIEGDVAYIIYIDDNGRERTRKTYASYLKKIE